MSPGVGTRTAWSRRRTGSDIPTGTETERDALGSGVPSVEAP
jgi:hypothetical protein